MDITKQCIVCERVLVRWMKDDPMYDEESWEFACGTKIRKERNILQHTTSGEVKLEDRYVVVAACVQEHQERVNAYLKEAAAKESAK